jgi:hypothetical protein
MAGEKGQLQPRPLGVREGGVSRNWALIVVVVIVKPNMQLQH